MAVTIPTVRQQAENAKSVAPALARADAATRDRALHAIALLLETEAARIQEANRHDLERAEAAPLRDRLSLAGDRVAEMARGLRAIADLPDPLGQVLRGWRRPNGLAISQVRVPLGLVGFIYESRPNVTIEATGLCLKSGNALLLRGSTSAWESNRVLVELVQRGLVAADLPPDLVQGVQNPDRDAVDELLGLTGLVDVVIPRGGAGLIQRVVQMARVPVIETGVGNCHVYVDASADEAMATRILVNAKCQRPGVCNAAETLLVHASRLSEWLPSALARLHEAGIEIRGDERVRAVFPAALAATSADWETEYLDRIIAARAVDSLEAAIAHIARYGTGHSEAIVTQDYEAAERFLAEVDAAAVYVNASTRFTDGGEFGFGAEVGISTQKLHARGPMGLPELTTTKYLVRGNGQVR
jgi:glutamate-5-semialdehyde dehydrogenase